MHKNYDRLLEVPGNCGGVEHMFFKISDELVSDGGKAPYRCVIALPVAMGKPAGRSSARLARKGRAGHG